MNKLESILTSDNIEEIVRSNEDYIFSIIPELKYEVGFSQNHPHHCYDVWNHTIEAMNIWRTILNLDSLYYYMI